MIFRWENVCHISETYPRLHQTRHTVRTPYIHISIPLFSLQTSNKRNQYADSYSYLPRDFLATRYCYISMHADMKFSPGAQRRFFCRLPAHDNLKIALPSHFRMEPYVDKFGKGAPSATDDLVHEAVITCKSPSRISKPVSWFRTEIKPVAAAALLLAAINSNDWKQMLRSPWLPAFPTGMCAYWQLLNTIQKCCSGARIVLIL